MGKAFDWMRGGFIIRLSNGTTVGVTTAHSLALGDPARLLEQVAFAVAGAEGFVMEADTLWGQPGEPRSADDFTVDYVLLHVDAPVDSALILTPDSRGAAQSGERVSLFSGLGGENDERRIIEGTVYSVSNTAVWAVMDETFNPGGMSSSPFVSQHTGQVVGMVIAASPRGNRVTTGMHPIGSVVAKAEAAREFPIIAEFQR